MLYTFNRYYLTSHVARKASRDIYLAYHVYAPEHSVLLKIFDAKCLNPAADRKNFWLQEKRFQQLAHRSVVPVLDLGVEQGQPYMVREYIPGGSLRQQLDHLSMHRLSLDEALHIVMQVGHIVSYAHTQSVLHLNIKPENIFFNTRGDALLADFSLEGLVSETKFMQKLDDRMVSYMAPEQLTGILSAMVSEQLVGPISNGGGPERSTDSIGRESDQYALGCLAYELLTGKLPFTTKDLPRLWQPSLRATRPTAPATHLPTLPHAVDAVILQALSKRPIERYEDVAAFLTSLKSAAQPEPPIFPFAYLIPNNQLPAPRQAVTDAQPSLLPSSTPTPPMQHTEGLRAGSSTQTHQQPAPVARHAPSSQRGATSTPADYRQEKVSAPLPAEEEARYAPFAGPQPSDDAQLTDEHAFDQFLLKQTDELADEHAFDQSLFQQTDKLADEYALNQSLLQQTDELAKAVQDVASAEEYELELVTSSWHIEATHTPSETLSLDIPEETLIAYEDEQDHLEDELSFTRRDGLPADDIMLDPLADDIMLDPLADDIMLDPLADELSPAFFAQNEQDNGQDFSGDDVLPAQDAMSDLLESEPQPATLADNDEDRDDLFAAFAALLDPSAEEQPVVFPKADLQDPVAEEPLAPVRDIVQHAPDVPAVRTTSAQMSDFSMPKRSFLLMKMLTESQKDNFSSPLEPIQASAPGTPSLDPFLDAHDDSEVLDARDNTLYFDVHDDSEILDARSDKQYLDAHDDSVVLDTYSDKQYLDVHNDNSMVLDTRSDNPYFDAHDDNSMVLDAHSDNPYFDAHDGNSMVLDVRSDNLYFDARNDSPYLEANSVPSAPAPQPVRTSVASGNTIVRPVTVAAAPISQTPVQVRPRKRKVNALLIVLLAFTVTVTVLAYMFNPDIMSTVQHSPSTIVSMIQHSPLTAMTFAHAKPTPTPQPTPTPKPTPSPTATPVPVPNLLTNSTFQGLKGWTCTGATVEDNTLAISNKGPGICSQTLTLQKNKTYHCTVSVSGSYPQIGIAGWIYWYADDNMSGYYPLTETFSTGPTTSWTLTLTIFGKSATGPAYFQNASVTLKQ